MFEQFELERVDVGEATLRVRHGGTGPAVLLLHGHPRTHATWHRVAPLLATEHTVVCPDLRGGRLDCGHHMAEEAPEELAAELRSFLASAATGAQTR